uniref:restriction endonuclease subunit S n=1 Tax=Candidatus Fimivicinus sp. TaxID=3056640 RepID=UPI003FEEE6AE
MSAYAEYKEINLPWLKAIPIHWEVRRNKNIFTEQKEIVGEKLSDYTLLSLTLNGIVPRDMEGGGKFPESFDKYKVVRSGDMAFCLFDIDETPRTVGLSGHDGMLTGAYTIMHISNINSRFIYYYYLSLDNGKMLKPLYSGLRKTININTFQSTKVPVPPRDEQNQIVRFLDWKVSSINKLINIKKKEIKNIDALKRSMISHAITHGLSSDAPMKYSGVKWLGDIPAHWQIVKLRQMLHPVSEKNHPELPLLSVVREQGVILRDIEDTESNHNYIPDDLSGYKVVKKGQFAMNKMKAWQGSYGISEYTGIVSPAYFIFDVDFEDLEYFHFAIRSKVYVNFFAQASDGIRVGQWDLQIDKMKEIPFIAPPVEEQKTIVEYIKRTLPKYDVAIGKLSEEVNVLEEYKTKLIADTVTGKIDVRNVKIPKFEFVDENIDSVDEEAIGSESDPPEEE